MIEEGKQLRYRVGQVDCPQDDDQRFADLADAEEHAILLSYADSVIAVWDEATAEDDVDGEVVMLVYQRVVYNR